MSVQTIRAIGLSILAYFVMLSYAIARPATESLFLDAHTSRALPGVWLGVTVGVVLVVAIYNRFVAGTELLRLLGGCSIVSAALLALLLWARGAALPGVHYALYVWKDIYIVVLVEVYYSFANTVFPIRTARWVYALFGACGSVGGITGNLTVGAVATRVGTVTALWLLPLLLLAIGVGCMAFGRRFGRAAPRSAERPGPGLLAAARVVRGSSYLALVVLLLALMQGVVTLVDYQFNHIVEEHFVQTDERTAAIGSVYAVINGLTVALHGLTGLVLRLGGVPLTLLGIPILLGSGLAALAVIPRFFTAAVVKVASKSLDYTLFRVAKEILYIPLDYAEKTAGKSVVDMLTFRAAKGVASLMLLGLLAIEVGGLVEGLTWAMTVGWLLVTVLVNRRFRRKVSRHEEMASR